MGSEKEPRFDANLEDLPPELRWREWMGRVEAVLFASPDPVPREVLAKLVGSGTQIDLLIDDIRAELAQRPYELVKVAGGWMLRTRAQFGTAIQKAAQSDDQGVSLSEAELGVLATIAYQQPISRAELKDVFGKDVNRDLIARLQYKKLIANGPRSPKAGAPHTFVTTQEFLVAFDLESLRDLPEMDFPVRIPQKMQSPQAKKNLS